MITIRAREKMQKRDKRACSKGAYGHTPFLTVLLLVLLSAPGAYGAAAPSANFEQEWSKLIAAAKQEGTLMVASGGAPSRQYRPVVDAFSKKFGVKVEVSTGNATDTVNRVLAERKAGRYIMDVALISSRENNQRLVPSESLVPFPPLLIHPEVVDTSNWYLGRHWYADKASAYAFIYHVTKEDQYETWYNTDKLKEAEVATIKKQTDFFDPRWKGKILGQGMGDPSGIRQMIDSYFEPDRGQEWIRTYLLNAGVTFSMTAGSWKPGSSVEDFRCKPSPPAARNSRAGEKGAPDQADISSQASGMMRAAGPVAAYQYFPMRRIPTQPNSS